jgi:predicted ATPase/class 3 adenylate cyclase
MPRSPASDLPTGTLTILFTDIEGSTRLLQALGTDSYTSLLAEHHRLIREAINAGEGLEIKTEGDAFFAIFPRAHDGVAATVQAQRSIFAADWPQGSSVTVRMGMHTGDLQVSHGDYVGLDVHRAARIAAAAHGGQVLLSDATRSIVAAALPPGVSVRDLGEHRLKDIDRPEHLHQLVIEGLPADFPPVRALSTRFNLLPVELSSFVGRERELERARTLFADARLLTLTGPGGTGKTRLAIELARSVADDFADGAAFVPLAAISDPALVSPTIRHTLGISEEPGRTPVETLAARLAGREVLLVLDNFEQVVAAASSVAVLLATVPDLKLIVTSRVALRITGEQEFPVPPLAVPTAADAVDVEHLSRTDSVALFVQRARLFRPDFELTPDNAGAVAAICARLDGLPLALELAASRIKVLPPAALLERLSRSLDVLQSTAADRTDRQRTLRGAIDWSYNLLTEQEQKLFRRLAIFVGGFRLDNAEGVVNAAGELQIDLLDGVSALVDNSLVRPLTDIAEVRFGMLETILAYGREQLAAAGEFEATAEAHARRVFEIVEDAELKLTTGGEWLDHVEANVDNLRAALTWLAEHDIESALLAAGRVWRFWHLRGHLREGSATLRALLDDPRGRAPTFARAKALIGHAGLVYWQTNYDEARTHYEEALEIARQLRDETLEVEVLYSLAYVRGIERDYAGAIRDLRQARDIYERLGDELMATWALEAIGMNETLAGRHAESVPILEDGIARFERLGDTFGLRNAIAVLSRAMMHLSRLDEARLLNMRVTELALSQKDATSLSASLEDAASLAVLAGDFEKAAILTGAAHRIVDETGAQPPPALVNRIDAMPTLQSRLPPARLEELLAEGRGLPTDQAVAIALADPPSNE